MRERQRRLVPDAVPMPTFSCLEALTGVSLKVGVDGVRRISILSKGLRLHLLAAYLKSLQELQTVIT